MKGIKNKLLSCDTCMKLLEKKIDSNNCRYCYNWNVLEAKYSKECMKSIANSCKYPFVLTLNTKKRKVKKYLIV